jgi:hypothetical protein
VAHLQTGLAEFSYPLDQSRQVHQHLWFLPLVLDIRGEQKLVHPRRWIVHFYQDPPLLGTLPTALEGSLNVLILTVLT